MRDAEVKIRDFGRKWVPKDSVIGRKKAEEISAAQHIEHFIRINELQEQKRLGKQGEKLIDFLQILRAVSVKIGSGQVSNVAEAQNGISDARLGQREHGRSATQGALVVRTQTHAQNLDLNGDGMGTK